MLYFGGKMIYKTMINAFAALFFLSSSAYAQSDADRSRDPSEVGCSYFAKGEVCRQNTYKTLVDILRRPVPSEAKDKKTAWEMVIIQLKETALYNQENKANPIAAVDVGARVEVKEGTYAIKGMLRYRSMENTLRAATDDINIYGVAADTVLGDGDGRFDDKERLMLKNNYWYDRILDFAGKKIK